MTDECRHGFEPELCAVCNPPKTPEKPAAARQSRVAGIRTTRPSRPAAQRGSSAKTKTVRVDQQRLFHVTHTRNLPAILAGGSILCDDLLHDDAQSGPCEVALSSEENRAARRRITIDDAAVSAYVPFFLSPDASVWGSIRSREPNVRLDSDLVRTSPTDYVMLVATVASIRAIDGDMVIADGDAAAGLTRFASEPDQADRMLARFALDDSGEQKLVAEALVRGEVPVSALSIIGVSSIKQRERVKQMLADAGLRTKVAAHQPWFVAQ
ncbi:DarT ssDNA thymidine ADP-ribosyltransferase family protein [Paramicrobacterium fandaimingii]|uniref:DarT ssDNA thymidine ADP-ribosyltransferase family protein n=1 Tax=Paramicrobacterium fandaimingii TaxID=2708079 RepID=UPI0014214EFA|nr:DarT ssDNA thymidine ADP-ribosyltransferase family protein [Microbacterium fandaimingii]